MGRGNHRAKFNNDFQLFLKKLIASSLFLLFQVPKLNIIFSLKVYTVFGELVSLQGSCGSFHAWEAKNFSERLIRHEF